MGIIVCGLNGSGKSSLGKVLAKQLRYYHTARSTQNDSDSTCQGTFIS